MDIGTWISSSLSKTIDMPEKYLVIHPNYYIHWQTCGHDILYSLEDWGIKKSLFKYQTGKMNRKFKKYKPVIIIPMPVICKNKIKIIIKTFNSKTLT